MLKELITCCQVFNREMSDHYFSTALTKAEAQSWIIA
jgi:hypothetical protein